MLAVKEWEQTQAEEELLVKLYISPRINEFASLGWTEDQVGAFLRSQYETQKNYYLHQYPDAHYEMIYKEDVC